MGVDRVDGDWLWVTNKKSGWLHRSAVIPAKQAVDMFTAALRRTPGDARLFARRGLARAPEPGLCRRPERLQRSLAAAPGEAVYYGDRGCIRLALGDADQAIADFREEARRIDSEEESRRAIRLEWLEQRVADAEATKAGETAVSARGQALRRRRTIAAQLGYSSSYSSLNSCPASATSPDLKPSLNQRIRCSDVPWVKASGTT